MRFSFVEAKGLGVERSYFLSLPKVADHRGNLSYIESGNHIPFEIRRVYFLYDVPFGSVRGGHAHRLLQQIILPISGSFEVFLDDGKKQQAVTVKNPSEGLYVGPGVWRELRSFTSGATALVVASDFYNADEYIRNYEEFLHFAEKLAH